MHSTKAPPLKGRGTGNNLAGRFALTESETIDDGWFLEEEPSHPDTQTLPELAKRIITTNQSPDIPFSQSINPYRGCEHGCIYCYARPCHAYVDLSPGLDFETRLFYKQGAAKLLEQELKKKNYRCAPIALGSNTDPYQPIEKEHRVTRSLLEVMRAFNQPVSIVTKSTLVLRDLDILTEMARKNLCVVCISVTTLDNNLKRIMEPRTASPAARLRALQTLNEAGIRTAVMASR